ncbi:hypothetical protein BV20DRAFT_199565 [Pilatotrama ljubarskyi]|nr:hypothetical protein BV20DRAFT_199565 [Pilatotrama ljubarskyi]
MDWESGFVRWAASASGSRSIVRFGRGGAGNERGVLDRAIRPLPVIQSALTAHRGNRRAASTAHNRNRSNLGRPWEPMGAHSDSSTDGARPSHHPDIITTGQVMGQLALRHLHAEKTRPQQRLSTAAGEMNVVLYCARSGRRPRCGEVRNFGEGEERRTDVQAACSRSGNAG